MYKDSSRVKGNIGESLARKHLQDEGIEIVTSNYHSKYGEIDIIATTDKYIIFVEVKLRKEFSMVNPIESVSKAKRQKLIKTAMIYLNEYPSCLQPRFDVIAIESGDYPKIEHIENAFGLEEM